MSKPSETLKKELNEMYHVAFGNCEKCNYEKCSTYKKICACKFKFDYAAHIGEKYGEGKYKVLCVGKEGLYYHDKSSDTASILDAKNRHYQGTIYTLALLDGKEPRSISYNDLKELITKP